MRVAEAAGLQRIVRARVRGLPASIGANPAGKVATIVAGMLAGADCIDDLDVVRHGGMPAPVRWGVRPLDAGFVPARVHPRTRVAATVRSPRPARRAGPADPVAGRRGRYED